MSTTTLLHAFVRFLRNFTCVGMVGYRICMHKINEAYPVVVHEKPFITELFGGHS